jgi:hypothetical protein
LHVSASSIPSLYEDLMSCALPRLWTLLASASLRAQVKLSTAWFSGEQVTGRPWGENSSVRSS